MIAFVVPSRGRPENISALVDALAQTREGQSGLIVAVDDDDPKLEEYQALQPKLDAFATLRIGKRLRLCGTLNEIATEIADEYEFVGFMGDDHRPTTQGWDVTMMNNLVQLRTGIVYGNDLIQRSLLPTQVAMTSDIIRTLGFMAPPVLQHMYLDNFWLKLGIGLDRIRYLEDVVIEHLHPIAGKAEWDDSYRETNSGEIYERDQKAFNEYVEKDFVADLAKVKALL